MSCRVATRLLARTLPSRAQPVCAAAIRKRRAHDEESALYVVPREYLAMTPVMQSRVRQGEPPASHDSTKSAARNRRDAVGSRTEPPRDDRHQCGISFKVRLV